MIKDRHIYSFHRLLDAAQKQQRVLAKNISNQHTPGYRREEVDFDGIIRELEGKHSVRMEHTEESHLLSLRERKHRKIEPVRTPDPIERGEVNNVDIDEEMAATARVQLYYTMLAKSMKEKFKKFNMTITGKV